MATKNTSKKRGNHSEKAGQKEKGNRAKQNITAENPQSPENGQPRCLEIAKGGVKTGGDFARLMAALMSDVIEGRVSAQTANAACNAGGKLLKVVDMQIKYATRNGKGRERELNLLNSGSTS